VTIETTEADPKKKPVVVHPAARDRVVAAYPGYPGKAAVADVAGDHAFWWPSMRVADGHAGTAPTFVYRYDLAPRLVRLVGLDVAKDLCFTGRRISGVEAAALGLVTHLADDPLAAAPKLGQQFVRPQPARRIGVLRAAQPRQPLVLGQTEPELHVERVGLNVRHLPPSPTDLADSPAAAWLDARVAVHTTPSAPTKPMPPAWAPRCWALKSSAITRA